MMNEYQATREEEADGSWALDEGVRREQHDPEASQDEHLDPLEHLRIGVPLSVGQEEQAAQGAQSEPLGRGEHLGTPCIRDVPDGRWPCEEYDGDGEEQEDASA
jgi:hypothetical protein